MSFFSSVKVNVAFLFTCLIGSSRIPDSFHWILFPCFAVH